MKQKIQIRSFAVRWTFSKSPILAACSVLALPVSGCVTIDAPNKPIVIELNINIKQEVIYKLDRASKQVIADNPGVF